MCLEKCRLMKRVKYGGVVLKSAVGDCKGYRERHVNVKMIKASNDNE